VATLKLTNVSEIPVEAEAIRPENLLGKTPTEIAALAVTCGNQPAQIGDFFNVTGDGGPDITLEGDLARVKLIGAGMTSGTITVQGSVGMHLGAGMSGGTIDVYGNAGDWAGAEMRGGQIRIRGDAGHGLGGAYRGSPKGMNRGTIVVDGRAGNEAGATMRRGLIVIGGDTGDFAGAFMIAGTVLVFGMLGARPGAGMKRGSIITFRPPRLLPSFRYDCTYSPAYAGLLLRHLRSLGIEVPGDYSSGRYRRYSGDLTSLGKGEVLVWEGA
jgi:formylmethanofuran dehydrogenase subunit C